MIKAIAKGPDGRDLLVLGLSFGNLDRFRSQPGDTYIRIDGRELGLDCDVMIFSGETENDLGRMISEFIGPGTKVSIDKRFKQ